MESTDSLEPKGYREIGELLLQARKDARISLDEASRALHIRVRYLEAMEEGSLDELPGLPYIRGYIQTYAGYLGLDRKEVLRRFDAVERSMRAENVYFPQALGKEKKPTPKIIWGGLAAAFACYFLWYVASNNASRSISTVDSFPMEKAKQAYISAETIEHVACLRAHDGTYPPCTLIKPPKDFRVSPLDRPLITVLEMKVLPLVDPAEYEKILEPARPKEEAAPVKKETKENLKVEKPEKPVKEEPVKQELVREKPQKKEDEREEEDRYRYPSRSDF